MKKIGKSCPVFIGINFDQESQPHDFLGPEGTFTQEAALKHFGHGVSTLDCGTIDEIFHQVETDNAQYGVVPIENSSNGVIGTSLDMLYSHDLNICGEVEIAVAHHLMMQDQS